MIKGIFISEDGFIQALGEITTLEHIIKAMHRNLPEFERQEKERVLSSLGDEELEKLLQERKSKATAKNGITEP